MIIVFRCKNYLHTIPYHTLLNHFIQSKSYIPNQSRKFKSTDQCILKKNMDILNILILLISLLVSFIYLKTILEKRKEPKNFPPGPRSYLPLIGGLIKTGREPHKAFFEMRAKWGDIFSYDMGPIRVVTINNYKLIKEALAQYEFNGRRTARSFLLKQANEEPHGILFNQGKAHQDQRRFTLKNLRDFGFGKGSMESLMEIEIRELLETFKNLKNCPILIRNEFNASVLNSLWSIVAGSRFEQNDSKLLDIFNRITEDVKFAVILTFYPWFFRIAEIFPSFLGGVVANYIENSRFCLDFMKKEIESHKKSYQENSERDFIDRYLTEINKETDTNSSFSGSEGEKNLTTVIHDIFIAGAETTSTTLTWAAHLLAIHPEIQEKMHQEIKSVIGLNRDPCLYDKAMLPYTEACIYEIQRYSVIIPSFPHDTITDIKNFHGFDIPKDTMIIYNLYACLHDPDVWENPGEFKPERFLSEDGQKTVKPEAFIPFSTGKRSCLGETLARDSLFLFTTSIFQRFKIIPDPTRPIPTKIDNICGATNMPISFPLIFKDRLDD